MPDLLILSRTAAYEKAMHERYMLYLEQLFFPVVNGARQPIFTEENDERMEYMKLSETKRNAQLAAQGQIEPDFEVQAWMENRDGAHERLIELQAKFEEQRNGQ